MNEGRHRAGGSAPSTLLVVGTAINALGSGVYLPLSLLLLSGLSELSVAAVGVTLTIAQVTAVVAMPQVGILLDRLGPKVVLIAAMVMQAVGFVLYSVVQSTASFVAVTVMIALGNQAGKTARPTVIAELARDRGRDRLLALNRSLANAGLGLGGLVLALTSAEDSRAYTAICLFNAATFLIAALLALPLPAPARRSQDGQAPFRALSSLRDASYARFLGSNLCGALLYAALTIFIPLYVVTALHQPPRLAGILFVVNTLIVAIGGVPAVAFMHRVGMSRLRGARLGMVLLAAGIAALPAGELLPEELVPVFALVLMVVYSVGELLHSPTSSALSLSLAPDGQRGRYQTQFQMTMTAGTAIAPAAFMLLSSYRPSAGAALAGACGVIGFALLQGMPDTVDR